MRLALYLRVSTDDQTVASQRAALVEWAERAGHEVVETYVDEGVSGAKARRPALDAMRADATRRRFDMVAAWSVCRIGRSLAQCIEIMQELEALGIGLYLHQQSVDSSTPAGRAMLQMAGVFAEFERAMIIERTKAGMAAAAQRGKFPGRPKAHKRDERIRELLSQGVTIREIARQVGCSNRCVYAVKREAA